MSKQSVPGNISFLMIRRPPRSTPYRPVRRKWFVSNVILLLLVVIVAALLIADLTLLKPISDVAGANLQATQPPHSPLSDGYLPPGLTRCQPPSPPAICGSGVSPAPQ